MNPTQKHCTVGEFPSAVVPTNGNGGHMRLAEQHKSPGQDKGMVIRKMKSLVAQAVRLLDSRGKNGNHARCNRALNEFLEAWETWK